MSESLDADPAALCASIGGDGGEEMSKEYDPYADVRKQIVVALTDARDLALLDCRHNAALKFSHALKLVVERFSEIEEERR